MMEFLKTPHIDFIGLRRVAYVISAAVLATGLWAVAQLAAGRGKLGIDFEGGTLISVMFEGQPELTAEELRAILRKNALNDKDVQAVSGESKFLIRLKRGELEVGKGKEQMTRILTEALPGRTFTIDRNEEVGPAVGRKLQEQALLAILLSSAAVLLYIWFRFEFRFGVGATVATVHDVLATLAVLVLLQKEMTLLIVTAILTIAGYSLTDTVVIYDRIRENMKARKKDETFEGCVNRSLNEVLSRTIITAGTALLSTLALLMWGGEVIHDFSLALFVGILVGIYSSPFVAAPLVVEWERRSPVVEQKLRG